VTEQRADRGADQVAEQARVSSWNIANALTVFRIVLVPFVAWLLLARDGDDAWLRLGAFGLFALASYTDKVDGDLARSRGLITDFGKIADPIADKLLLGAVFVGLSLLGEVWWWLTAVILVREVGITLLRFVVIRYGVIAASPGGKLKTVLQMAAAGLLLLPWASWLDGTALDVVLLALQVLVVAAALVTVVTGVDYLVRAIRLVRGGRAR